MKKIYMIPTVEVLQLAPATLIAESLPTGGGTELEEDDILVKEQRHSAGSVWDDDWSN